MMVIEILYYTDSNLKIEEGFVLHYKYYNKIKIYNITTNSCY